MTIHKKMFVTDLDGTLFTDEKTIHAEDLKALEFLAGKGIIRVFATGRSLYSFQKAIEKMGFSSTCCDMPVDYVIFSTGAGIMECTHGEIIKKESLGTTDVRLISACFDSLGVDYMIHRPVPDTRYFVYKKGALSGDGENGYWDHERFDKPFGHCGVGHGSENAVSQEKVVHQIRGDDRFDQNTREKLKNPDFYARIALYRKFCRPMALKEGMDFGESTEILAIVPPCLGHETADKVQQALGDYSVIKATSPLDGKSIWIEVFPPQVSKSQAVEWLCARLQVAQQHVVSIGNDYNDLDLLKWSGRGFVVANTPADVQQGFESVASNNRCGVAEVILRKMGLLIQAS